MSRKTVKIPTLDSTFSKCIRESYDYICAKPNCPYCGNHSLRHVTGPFKRAECCHNNGRRRVGGRWHPDNVVCLCHEFHAYMDKHNDIKQQFFKDHLGEARYEMLSFRMHGNFKISPQERWEMNVHYKAQKKYCERLRREGQQGTLPVAAWD